jgi:hypothetical protein
MSEWAFSQKSNFKTYVRFISIIFSFKPNGESMKINILSDDKLISCFENFVRNERKITAQVLECIAEIDCRKLYLPSHTSLFDYLVKDFGYSPGAAMRRIDAARLLRELPETAGKFEDGTLTLSQANQIQRASREFKKVNYETLGSERKRNLVLQVQSATQKQTEQILAVELDLSVTPVQKETLHRDKSVTLTVTFTKEQMQILEQAQNMVSHAVVEKDWAEIFTHLAKREIARRTAVRSVPKQKVLKKSCDAEVLRQSCAAKGGDVSDQSRIVNSNSSTVVAAVTSDLLTTKYGQTTKISDKTRTKRPVIPAAIRKTLLHPNAICSYVDRHGKQCMSRRFLQIDHIHGWSLGGTHDPQNLQVICGIHNRIKFEQG